MKKLLVLLLLLVGCTTEPEPERVVEVQMPAVCASAPYYWNPNMRPSRWEVYLHQGNQISQFGTNWVNGSGLRLDCVASGQKYVIYFQ